MKKNKKLIEEDFNKKCADAEVKHTFYVKKVLVDPMEKPNYTRIFIELDLKKFKGNIDDLEWAMIMFQPNDVAAFITEVRKENNGRVLCFCALHDISTKFPKIKKRDEFIYGR